MVGVVDTPTARWNGVSARRIDASALYVNMAESFISAETPMEYLLFGAYETILVVLTIGVACCWEDSGVGIGLV